MLIAVCLDANNQFIPLAIAIEDEETTLGNVLFRTSVQPCGARVDSTCVTLNGSGIQLAVGPQPLRLRNHNFGLAHRIIVKRIATSPHDPLGITDSACKNQLIVVSVQYGPFNTYIPIRSTTIGKSRVARDPIAMHTSWRSNSDIASVTSSMKTLDIEFERINNADSIRSSRRTIHNQQTHPIYCDWFACDWFLLQLVSLATGLLATGFSCDWFACDWFLLRLVSLATGLLATGFSCD
ncbi:hypothetical protein F511_35859 [Dorcoceras hygrometricum]|uniref:Uncharacterized protein n=1 Tax=Dorcoceras hygrometricum TaxID=472368 RepID=A0A2Z7AZQ6_9LAMI|nr:hypothetical protein F511_35859 [Dorcoceras hygrometricum]